MKNVSLPKKLQIIPDNAFYNCTSLSEIYIPASVTQVSMLIEEGDSVFHGCSSLRSIVVDPENEKYYSKNNCIMEKESKTLVVACNGSKIPEEAKVIGTSAFSGTDYTNVTVPNGVEAIQYGAFRNCQRLTSVVFPSSITNIDGDVFMTNKIIEVNVEKGSYAENWAKKYQYKYKIQYIGGTSGSTEEVTTEDLKEHKNTVTADTTVASTTAENVNTSTSINKNKKESIYAIPQAGCRVKITCDTPNKRTVSYLGMYGKKTNFVMIPNTVAIDGITYRVTSIAKNALKNKKNVKQVTIGKNIVTVGEGAFYNCSNLRKIIVKSLQLKQVKKNVLKKTNKKLLIKLPKKKSRSYQKLFKKKGNTKVSFK